MSSILETIDPMVTFLPYIFIYNVFIHKQRCWFKGADR